MTTKQELKDAIAKHCINHVKYGAGLSTEEVTLATLHAEWMAIEAMIEELIPDDQ